MKTFVNWANIFKDKMKHIPPPLCTFCVQAVQLFSGWKETWVGYLTTTLFYLSATFHFWTRYWTMWQFLSSKYPWRTWIIETHFNLVSCLDMRREILSSLWMTCTGNCIMGSVFLLELLDLLDFWAAFHVIDHGVFLNYFSGIGFGDLFYSVSGHSWKGELRRWFGGTPFWGPSHWPVVSPRILFCPLYYLTPTWNP